MKVLRKYGTQAVKNIGVDAVEQKLRQNLPILPPIADSMLNKRMMPLVRRKVGMAIDNAVKQILGQKGERNGLGSSESGGPTTSRLNENGSESCLEDGSPTRPSGLEERSSRVSPSGIETALRSAA